MKIRYLVDKEHTADKYYWRAYLPNEFLQQNMIDSECISHDIDVDEDTDILVLPKLCVAPNDRVEASEWFQALRDANILVVYDADDDIWTPAYTKYLFNLQYNVSRHDKDALILELETIRASTIWTMRQCDAVTVTNKVLEERARYYANNNTPIHVVENAIDVHGFTQTLKVNPPVFIPGKYTVGWAGGAKTVLDLHNMFEGWNTVASSFLKDEVHFVIAGWRPNLDRYRWLQYGRNVTYIGWSDIDEYGSSMQVNIGCVCVDDNDFNVAKSPIKAWEFSLTGALVLGSKPLYGAEPIPYCETPEDWAKTLTYYLEHVDARDAMADAYRKYVHTYKDIKDNWVYWMDAYSKILHESKQHASTTVQV